MQRLKSVFKDAKGLHARIDSYLSQSSTLKIGLIPLKSREASASVLDAVIDDPVESTAWSTAVANRILTKDVLVTQSPSFEFIETHNSMVVYPVPFNGPALEYLEVSSLKDSWEHLKTCSLHAYLTDNGTAGIDSEYPHLIIVDSPSSNPDAGVRTSTTETDKNIPYIGERIPIDSRKALRANKLLRESPSNATKFLQLRKESRIEELKALFDRDSVYMALKKSIITSCRRQIAEISSTHKIGTEPLAEFTKYKRRVWSEQAHRELQGNFLPKLRQVLYKDLAFYKLYARTDDVESLVTHVNEHALPLSQSQLQYLKGKLSQGTVSTDSATTKTVSYENFFKESPISGLASALTPATLKLQNKALMSVLACLGIQVPVSAVALSGVFWGGLDWFSMGAVFSLGIVSGLRKLQLDWLKATKQYETIAEEQGLHAISQAENQLWEIGERASEEVENRKQEMQQALNEALQEEEK